MSEGEALRLASQPGDQGVRVGVVRPLRFAEQQVAPVGGPRRSNTLAEGHLPPHVAQIDQPAQGTAQVRGRLTDAARELAQPATRVPTSPSSEMGLNGAAHVVQRRRDGLPCSTPLRSRTSAAASPTSTVVGGELRVGGGQSNPDRVRDNAVLRVPAIAPRLLQQRRLAATAAVHGPMISESSGRDRARGRASPRTRSKNGRPTASTVLYRQYAYQALLAHSPSLSYPSACSVIGYRVEGSTVRGLAGRVQQ